MPSGKSLALFSAALALRATRRSGCLGGLLAGGCRLAPLPAVQRAQKVPHLQTASSSAQRDRTAPPLH
eukprot:14963974-Alexandrium_andersonii.AAC.1